MTLARMSSSDLDFFNDEFFIDFATGAVVLLNELVAQMLSQDVSIIVSHWVVNKFSVPIGCASYELMSLCFVSVLSLLVRDRSGMKYGRIRID